MGATNNPPTAMMATTITFAVFESSDFSYPVSPRAFKVLNIPGEQNANHSTRNAVVMPTIPKETLFIPL